MTDSLIEGHPSPHHISVDDFGVSMSLPKTNPPRAILDPPLQIRQRRCKRRVLSCQCLEQRAILQKKSRLLQAPSDSLRPAPCLGLDFEVLSWLDLMRFSLSLIWKHIFAFCDPVVSYWSPFSLAVECSHHSDLALTVIELRSSVTWVYRVGQKKWTIFKSA